MKILLAVLLLVVSAQLPSCSNLLGGGEEEKIVGYVEEKFVSPSSDAGGPLKPFIVIDKREYMVPWEFWREVRIGDLVKYENGKWTIVKKYTP